MTSAPPDSRQRCTGDPFCNSIRLGGDPASGPKSWLSIRSSSHRTRARSVHAEVAWALWAALAVLGACRKPTTPAATADTAGAVVAAAPGPLPTAAASPPTLTLPKATTSVAIELRGDEPAWTQSAATAPFVDDSGGPARPYSMARALWDQQNLYLNLYAADQDIAAPATVTDAPLWLHDAFDVRVQADEPDAPIFALQFAPSGVISDARIDRAGQTDNRWQSGARVAIDLDGSLNQAAGEDDEEWLVFAAVPWSSLGITAKPGTRLRIYLGRCDTLRSGERRCGQWGGRAKAPEGIFLLGDATPTAR